MWGKEGGGRRVHFKPNEKGKNREWGWKECVGEVERFNCELVRVESPATGKRFRWGRGRQRLRKCRDTPSEAEHGMRAGLCLKKWLVSG